MKAEFIEYLESVTITPHLRSHLFTKIEECATMLESMSPEVAEDIFVSDVINPGDRQRTFHSLWLFSKEYVMEARGLQDQTQRYILCVLRKNVIGLDISQQNNGWSEPREDSLLVVNVNLGVFGGFHLRAAAKNCIKLRKIVEERIKPNYYR